MITYEKTTPDHIDYIAPRMRAEDVAELRASDPTATPWKALAFSVVLSDGTARTALVDGVPVAVYGIYPQTLTDDASPWMLGTDQMEDHAVTLVKHGREVTELWLEEYPRLINEVWVKNLTSIRWLRSLGYTIGGARIKARTGEAFRVFYKKGRSYV